MSPVHHSIDYIEINVSDMAAARAFYEQAFGWTFNDYGPDYSGIRAASGDGEVGGLNGTATPTPEDRSSCSTPTTSMPPSLRSRQPAGP